MGVVCGVGITEGEDGVGLGKEFFGELVITAQERTEALRDAKV